MRCNDKATDYIRRKLGFNLINLPRASFTPGLILFRNPNDATVSIYGPMTDIVLAPAPALPTIQRDIPVGAISGIKTSKFNADIGLKFLKLFLSALGAKSLGIEAVYSKASTIEFEYTNVYQDFMFPASVGKFLRRATPDTEWFFEQFDEPDEAYIITDVIRSNSFSTKAYSEDGAGIDINLGALKEILGIESGLKIEQKEDLKISYEGQQSLAFGLKVCSFGAVIKDGKARFTMSYSTNVPVVPKGTDEVPEDASPQTVLLEPDGLLKVR